MVGYWFKSNILSFILFFFVLAFAILHKEPSLPFKVGDRVELIEPFYEENQQQHSVTFVVTQIKGKWLNTGGGLWVNSDLYICVDIEKP